MNLTDILKKPLVIAGLILLVFIVGYFLMKEKNGNQPSGNLFDKETSDPERLFLSPPESAKPRVMWMWMGSSVSKEGIRKDLEALKEAGFGGVTMFSLADLTTLYAYDLENSVNGEIIAWTEPWWELVRFAVQECDRLGLDFGMFNCPGYETSGGKWISAEFSMQEICHSEMSVQGGAPLKLSVPKPVVDLHAVMLGPVHNPETGKLEKPVIPERGTYYRDIAVLAVPAKGNVPKEKVIDLSKKMTAEGELKCELPVGDWTIYRFGHTTRGSLIYPAQWKAAGFECDKMNPAAVSFHLDHIIGEAKRHLGRFFGTTFSHFHFDSYEAGISNWTPSMREEFRKRRGYDLTPFLITFANRFIADSAETEKFRGDFKATIEDLYNDVYFTTIQKKLHAAGIRFSCEPYGGPWRQDDVMPKVDRILTEFWTNDSIYTPYKVEPTKEAAVKAGKNIIEAEAFSGAPNMSLWAETPFWLKSIGDAAFCAGINRYVLHRFVQQSFDEAYKPGATMGQWGSHFDRTQTWWNFSKAMVGYWQRCQALLQWGKLVEDPDEFKVNAKQNGIRSIHRSNGKDDLFFVANTSRTPVKADCVFKNYNKAPELWDPVTSSVRALPDFRILDDKIIIPLEFASSQSFFIVFRKPLEKTARTVRRSNFPGYTTVVDLSEDWKVKFDPKWGGPDSPVTFSKLEDWTKNADRGIQYYSGTATYTKTFQIQDDPAGKQLVLDLGAVNHIARVKLNGTELGILWCAPWQLRIPAGTVKPKENRIEIEIANTWANRLIGDEQEPDDCEWVPVDFGYGKFKYLKKLPDWFLNHTPRPSKGRYCFTTYNYFTKDSPLIPSGLSGPVLILKEN